jgi:nucleotide-binding universal stress UspA family protein
MFKTVLFPIDQSRESRQAAETVAKVVQTCNSRLVLLSVVEDPSTEEKGAEQPTTMTSPEAIAQLLENAKSLFAGMGVNTETIERKGKPAFTICDVADEIEAELIVMGCRGLGLTDEGMADSVTNRVINLSPCPVLVVP